MSLLNHSSSEPILPSESDVSLARETSRKLAAYMEPDQIMHVTIQDTKGNQADIQLPPSAVRLLLNALEQMANGNAISLIPLQAELTTKQAANLLNVSRPYLVKLLEEGAIPFRMVGSHRRVRVEDILAYKQKSYQERSKIMAELTAEAQEMKWGYE